MSRIDDLEARGAEVLRRAGDDPVGRFLIRLVAPGARRELRRLDRRFRSFVNDLSGAVGRVERADREGEREVIDVEVVSTERK